MDRPIPLFRNLSSKIASLPMMLIVLGVFVGGTAWTVLFSFTNIKILPFFTPREWMNGYVVFANYDRLNRYIEEAMVKADPLALWWPSSPSPGLLSFGDAWHDDRSGDMHFWSVWHEGKDFDHYRDVRPRFCSEFGFQSFPSMAAMRGFALPSEMNIASPLMDSHQKNKGGNARIAETMFRYFRFPIKKAIESALWQ